MRKWHEFGIQVNRLVYALAGCKFQADIDMANRFIAERIFYSEVSVRMMRQGRFHPHEEQALEMLVEIGRTEAELGREWACRLLSSGRHSKPEAVLQRFFPQQNAADGTHSNQIKPSPFSILFPRIAGGLAGSFLALLLWTYAINPAYPAPHELPLFREILWGLLIGLGLAVGLMTVDYFSIKKKESPTRLRWLMYLYLPASGVLGALLWKAASSLWFTHLPDALIRSTWLETFSFGAIYGLSFGVGVLLTHYHQHLALKYWQVLVLFVLVCGGLSLAGYILAILQPAFANQKDIDIFVGMMLRFGLIVLVGVLFPINQGCEESGIN